MCLRRFKVLVLRRQEELVGPPQHGIFAIIMPVDFVDALGPVSAAQKRPAPPGTRFRGRHKKTLYSNRLISTAFIYNFSKVIYIVMYITFGFSAFGRKKSYIYNKKLYMKAVDLRRLVCKDFLWRPRNLVPGGASRS